MNINYVLFIKNNALSFLKFQGKNNLLLRLYMKIFGIILRSHNIKYFNKNKFKKRIQSLTNKNYSLNI
jgi:hypothetical protein